MPGRPLCHAIASGILAAGTLLVGDATAQQPKAGPTRAFLTPASCAPCHNQGQGPLPRFLGEPKGPRLVRLDEFQTWRIDDKHAHAFDPLKGERGQRMAKVLGYDVTEANQCLSCHSTGFLPADSDASKKVAMTERDQGVGCTACHGPYRDWVGIHGLPGEPAAEWRKKTPANKSIEYGMTNLRDPVNRSKVCASCHVGDRNEGKVVTHDMYAAGHPPLPSIELATFEKSQPAHWWKASEVPLFRADADSAKPYGIDTKSLPATKSVVLGGAVALEESLRLLADLAENTKVEGVAPAAWPEYAQFECYACHHDLEAPEGVALDNWRQQRDSTGQRADGSKLGVPGRPQPRLWSQALARLGARITNDAQFDAAFAAFWAEFDKAPFGRAPGVAQAARALGVRAESLVKTLESTTLGADVPPRVLGELAKLAQDGVPDYDSARQLAAAFQSVYSEWKPAPANAAELEKVLKALTEMLRLDPYETRDEHAKLIRDAKVVDDALTAALIKLSEGEYSKAYAAAAKYDPKAFQEAMAALGNLLQAAPPGGAN